MVSFGAAEAFDLLSQAIAVQLLASCYTLLPASSASHLPLFQQSRDAKSVTALRLHSHHRFEPAAGHHARVSSEASSWPGLFAGPDPEDVLADRVCRNRRLKRSSGYTPRFAAIGWTDGSSPSGADHLRGESSSTTEATSSSQPGFLSRLICQTSTPRDPRRKYHTLFTSRLPPRRKKQKLPDHNCDDLSKPTRIRTKPLQSLTAQTVQRIPSALRLRHTQSVPRFTADNVAPTEHTKTSHRHSSNPSIGSLLTYQ
jgi:hypothetical protein